MFSQSVVVCLPEPRYILTVNSPSMLNFQLVSFSLSVAYSKPERYCNHILQSEKLERLCMRAYIVILSIIFYKGFLILFS